MLALIPNQIRSTSQFGVRGAISVQATNRKYQTKHHQYGYRRANVSLDHLPELRLKAAIWSSNSTTNVPSNAVNPSGCRTAPFSLFNSGKFGASRESQVPVVALKAWILPHEVDQKSMSARCCVNQPRDAAPQAHSSSWQGKGIAGAMLQQCQALIGHGNT